MNKSELLQKCTIMGIKNCSSKNKSQLIALIDAKQTTPGSTSVDGLQNTIISVTNTNTNTTSTDIIQRKYTFIEVCSGAGGLSAGLIKSGFTPVLLNDINSDCCKTLKHNHANANVVCGNMDKIDYSQHVDKIDLLTGGVPCQSFSQAGLRKGLDDPRGDLMMKFIEILNIIKPKTFMIENVKGLITHDEGNTIKKNNRGIKQE